MKRSTVAACLILTLVRAQTSSSPTCSPTLTANYPSPSVANGYTAHLVANNLTSPRGIKFDSSGALLVVEEGLGVSALNLVDSGQNCISLSNRTLVIDEPSLNHGIELSPDGTTLYASSGDTLWSWTYSPSSQTNTSAPQALVTGMAGSDHTSRTLRLSSHAPGIMLINRGSNENIDPQAQDISTGHSQIKAFNVTNATEAYDFNTQGLLMGWGLRNDVGIDEEPVTGGVWSVENSADEVNRAGVDIHENNPAEKLNFLGYLNGTHSPNQGANFGYPDCFAAWNASAIPSFTGGQTGTQFALDPTNDTTCSNTTLHPSPRLSFQAHTAPLDILFNPSGTAAWITFHGSWNRDVPVGYDLRVVAFSSNGEPTAANTSTTAAVPVMQNANVSVCAEEGACFRPVGLAWDAQGRLFMSSDETGEIYVVVRDHGNATSSVGGGVIATGTGSGTPAATSTSGGARESTTTVVGLFAAGLSVVFAMFLV